MLSRDRHPHVAARKSNRELQREIVERERAVDAPIGASYVPHAGLGHQPTWCGWPIGAATHPGKPIWEKYTGQRFEQYRDAGWRRWFDDEGRKQLELAWAHAVNEPENVGSAASVGTPIRPAPLRAATRGPDVEQDGSVAGVDRAVQDVDDRRGLEQSLRTLNASSSNAWPIHVTAARGHKELESSATPCHTTSARDTRHGVLQPC